MKKLTFAKDMKAALRKIDYMLKLDIDDPSMQVRWDAWNMQGDSVKELKDEWKRCITEQQTFQKRNRGKGRPFKNTFLHISDDQHMDIDNLKFVNDSIWGWISKACGDMYMGLLAYHFKGATFHFHLGINPVPLAQGLGYGMFRIAKNDTWWKNSMANAIMGGYAEASHALGFTTAEEKLEGVLGLSPGEGLISGQQPTYSDYFLDKRIEVIQEMRPGFISSEDGIQIDAERDEDLVLV